MPVVARSPSAERYERSASPEDDRDRDDGPGPSKRARMTVVDIQKRRLEKLLANPDKEVYIPENIGHSIRAPKDILKNVTGSSAAAGSGEFHVYKNSRRREAERVRFMETQARELEEQAAFQKRQEERNKATEAKTAKNRARRQKRKGGKGEKGEKSGMAAAPAAEDAQEAEGSGNQPPTATGSKLSAPQAVDNSNSNTEANKANEDASAAAGVEITVVDDD